MPLPNYSIYFDGIDIAGLNGVTVYNYKVNSLPPRKLTLHEIANKDLSILTRAEYNTKEIVVNAVVCGNTRTQSEILFLNLKTALQRINKALTISQYGEQINYTCTLYSIKDEWTGNEIEITLIFTASDPVGRATGTSQLISSATITLQSQGVTGTVAGSYPASPLITAEINSGTDMIDQKINIGNSATGQGITVTRTWTAGDVLSVDSENMIVAVNGAITDYEGAFPMFSPGVATVGYLDTFATRNVTLSGVYYKKYI